MCGLAQLSVGQKSKCPDFRTYLINEPRVKFLKFHYLCLDYPLAFSEIHLQQLQCCSNVLFVARERTVPPQPCCPTSAVSHLVCGRPKFVPTPTRGRLWTTFLTVAASGKLNMTATVERRRGRSNDRRIYRQTYRKSCTSLRSSVSSLLLAMKISTAVFCSRYRLEKMARISVNSHFPWRPSV